jgi:MoaA/NifB/PqqE/SkfB family radical SAM enzyme
VNRLVDFALAVAKNRAGGVPRPSWCTYLVTYRCNARCGMCDSWRMKPGRELTPAEVATVFGKLGRLDVVRVTGGEPFLRDDLDDVTDAIVRESRPLVLHVTTNGSMPEHVEKFAARHRRPKRLSVMVSLDGHRDVHDANRGARVTYDLALETVRRLAHLRRRRDGLDVAVNYTAISAQSLEDVPRVRADLAPLGVDLQVVLAYEASATYGLKLRGKKAEHLVPERGYPLHPDLATADVTGFVASELRATASLASGARRLGKRYYLRGLMARLRGDPSPAPRPPCVELRSHVRVMPDGSVPVCQFNGERVGDLRSESLRDVWHGARARESRAWVDACPGCWAECEVMPNAIYSADLLLSRLRRPEGARAAT